VVKFVVECLKYWVREMHVDGFRFDEGTILARGQDGVPLAYPPVVWNIELSESLMDTSRLLKKASFSINMRSSI
jgi:isoamylase